MSVSDTDVRRPNHDVTKPLPEDRLQVAVPMLGPVDADRMRDAARASATLQYIDESANRGGDANGNRNANGNGNGKYDSRTQTAEHTTAHRIGKAYRPTGAVSDNPNKSSSRTDDGYVTSKDYGDRCRAVRGRVDKRHKLPTERSGIQSRYIDLDYHHPLEDYLGTRPVRAILGYISRTRRSGKTMIEEIIESYANPAAPRWHRVKYWPFHKFIDRMRGSVSRETFRQRVAGHRPTVRGFVLTARSVAEYGLKLPQQFSAPLFAVWNFTNKCNMRCQHCYQDAGGKGLANELTHEERLALVDELAREYMAMISFAGGEPLIDPDVWPVLERCHHHGIHTSLATNGSLITPDVAARLASLSCKYIEISLDSVHAERHDSFRGIKGAWERTVRGMKNVVAQEGLRLGIAMCVTQKNYDEVDDMLKFAVDLGAKVFAYFNFIPVGRGLEMAHEDLSPQQREALLRKLNDWMQSRKISIMSTSPQFGRIALAFPPETSLQACSHLGGGGGTKARVVAKYLGGCGAGRCYVAIEPDGNITPCVYLPHRIMGNIRQRRFIDIYRNNEFIDLICDRDARTHHCEVCEFKHYCGGCLARADAYYGELNAGDPGCIFNAKHWEALTANLLPKSESPVYDCRRGL
jgi:radical SAM protein with 4Fe4S-binding SPASM domain